MKTRTILIWHIIGISFAAIAAEVFFLLCLFYFSGNLAPWLYYLLAFSGSLFNAALLVVDIVFYVLKKAVVYKSCVLAYFVLILAGIVMYVFLETGFFEIVQSEESLRGYLEKAGGWMGALFILIQFLQVVILPIPSTVTVVAGSALFGPLLGSIYSLIGILIGSLTAFLIGRYAGYRVVAWLIGKETLDKWLKKIKGKDKLLLSAMFILPVFPDDVLCFVAGLSSMSVWFFLAVIFLSRVLAIFTTSFSVSVIPFDTWWGILIWIVLIAAIIVLVIVLYKKIETIQDWILKKIHRETRIEKKIDKDEFRVEVIDPDGSIVSKGVEKETPENGKDEKSNKKE